MSDAHKWAQSLINWLVTINISSLTGFLNIAFLPSRLSVALGSCSHREPLMKLAVRGLARDITLLSSSGCNR